VFIFAQYVKLRGDDILLLANFVSVYSFPALSKCKVITKYFINDALCVNVFSFSILSCQM